MRTSITAVAASGVVIALGAWVVAGVGAGASAAAGAAIATANLWLLARIIAALLPRDGAQARAQSRAAWVLVATLKMFALVAAVWLALRHGAVRPVPMLVGLCALPIGIAIGSLVSDRSEP